MTAPQIAGPAGPAAKKKSSDGWVGRRFHPFRPDLRADPGWRHGRLGGDRPAFRSAVIATGPASRAGPETGRPTSRWRRRSARFGPLMGTRSRAGDVLAEAGRHAAARQTWPRWRASFSRSWPGAAGWRPRSPASREIEFDPELVERAGDRSAGRDVDGGTAGALPRPAQLHRQAVRHS